MASTINAKNTSTGVVITPDASGQLELQTADTTRMTIDVNGNVGIGTTSPSFPLDVNKAGGGAIRGGHGFNWYNSDNTNNYYIYNAGATGSSNANLLFVQGGVAERMRIDSSGNVGIGVTAPNANLEVSGAGNREIRITSTSTGEPILGMWVPGTTFTFFKIERSTGNLVISDGTERVRLNGANFMFNSGYGSVATAYGCRAWVNFNGTGTVAIRGSGNVSSITDGGVGIYTINFTTAMPNVNYNAVGASARASNDYGYGIRLMTFATGSLGINTITNNAATLVDYETVCVSIFR